MNLPEDRLPSRNEHRPRLFSLADVALLSGAVVMVTTWAGQWHAADGGQQAILDACLLERVAPRAMADALDGLLPRRTQVRVAAAAERPADGH